MKLYNTLSRKVEELSPLAPPEVSVYTCGPTVYDYPHIGNWFTFIRYDLLIRTLKLSGYKPKWVLNITDVGHLTSDSDEGEDKLAKGAEKEGKTAWEVADYYTNYFLSALGRLNFETPWQLPRATKHLSEQIALIQVLEDKGYTYLTSDGVYFDTPKFPRYKDFAALDLDEQQPGYRIEANPEKKNPSDFALWKFSPAGKKRDMEWDSPWGKGFPGWHIECSAMCLKYLGETVDIHCGGIDHIPVHHTNEIAQSETATGKPLAKLWLHTNHILIDEQKISKSLANGITLEDIEQKGFSLSALRLLVIESHYRSQSKFSWDSLASAQNRLLRYRNFAALKYQAPSESEDYTPLDLGSIMQDDLNTPLALVKLEQYLDSLDEQNLSKAAVNETVEKLDQLFGLSLSDEPDISTKQKELLQKREEARKSMDWTQADQLRDELSKQNLGINDRPFGPVWQRLS